MSRGQGLSRPAPNRPLRVVVAQLNAIVGDIEANLARAREALVQAEEWGADVALLPELFVVGYPPEDLLLRPSYVAAGEAAVARLAQATAKGGLTAVVGFAHSDGDLYNAAAVLHGGEVAGVYHKRFLPNYSVFDEERYFRRGRGPVPIFVRQGVRIAVTICEDMWHPAGPARDAALAGAQVLLNASASPFEVGKSARRRRMMSTRADDNGAFVVFCNLVGGQDELVFDGHSLVMGPDGGLLARGAAFEEDVFVVDLHPAAATRRRLLDPRNRSAAAPGHPAPASVLVPLAGGPEAPVAAPPPRADPPALGNLEATYAALVLGTRDYARKNGFEEAVVGLSGGIDSALTASVAVDALGGQNVLGVAMPSRYSSSASLQDARDLASNLGMRLRVVDIDSLFQGFLEELAPAFDGAAADVTEENLQPRIRGLVLMALSNKFGYLVLTTGNKSEMSVGFATLYGDTAGGFAPLKDVFKTRIYEVAKWRTARAGGPWIPARSVERAPSPELKPDQTDQDVLPPYKTLDAILEAYVEEERSVEEIVAAGFDAEVVQWVARRVDAAEYKRRQSPPGIKVTERAFGRDRRMPISKGRGRSLRSGGRAPG